MLIFAVDELACKQAPSLEIIADGVHLAFSGNKMESQSNTIQQLPSCERYAAKRSFRNSTSLSLMS
jgi:hypothetical protein